MRAILIFLILTVRAMAFDCDSEFLKEAKDLLASDHQNILSLQYQLTTLKLAKKSLEDNHNNLEASIRKLGKQIENGDQRILNRLEDLYRRHGINQDYQKILENFNTASYWNKETRFYNQDTSMFILAKKTLDPNEKELDNRDAAITWLAEKLSQKTGNKNSAKFNLTNISSHVASIAGAIKGQPKKSLDQVKKDIAELKEKLAKAFEDLKNDLSLTFKKNCFTENYSLLTCRKEDELVAAALRDLAIDIGEDKLYEFSLESQVKNRFGGKVEFKIRTNLKTVAEQKSWQATYPEAPTVIGSPYAGHESYDERVRWQKTLNQLSDEEKIKGFNQENGKSNYGVLDKAKRILTIYSKEGIVLGTTEVVLERAHGDEKKYGGAGIYKIDGSLNMTDQRGGKSQLNLGDKALECAGEQCLSANANELIQKYLVPDGTLYILPYDQENYFEIKNNKINFTTKRLSGPFFESNYTPKGKEAFPIEITINDARFLTDTSREFMNTLEKEKATIMELYGLDNDEYNDLVRYSFGILGNESEFGKNWRYDVKEAFPLGTAFVKETKRKVIDRSIQAYKDSDGFFSGIKNAASTYFKELVARDVRLLTGKTNTAALSRGPTQIKKVPKRIEEHYGVTKDNISKPSNSAVATIGFLAEAMVELKNRARSNSDITKENRLDYLHYIYMGSVNEIKNKTATPDKNIYLRQLKEYQKGVEIYQKAI